MSARGQENATDEPRPKGVTTSYVDIEIEDPLSFSLPPLPPAGVKDIRFSGNTKLCARDECKVELMNDDQLIQLESNIKDGPYS